MARAVVEALCALTAKRWPAAIYSNEEKHMMATLLAPVVMKRFNDPWFLKYREEFECVGFAAYMGFTGWQRVQAAAPKAAAPGASPFADGAPLRA
jgi:hypothetical protein